MNSQDIKQRLQKILAEEGLEDTTWILSLTEFDEPPLFSRSNAVDFMRELDDFQRGFVITEFAVEQLDRVATEIKRSSNHSNFFACITFLDWCLVKAGDQVVPTPSIFVSPNACKELTRFVVRKVASEEGHLVENWVNHLKRMDLCVRNTQIFEN